MEKKLSSNEVCLLSYLMTIPGARQYGVDMSGFNFEDKLEATFKKLVEKDYLNIDQEKQKIIINVE